MGLTPPPFEQCLKKLHNWCGMASLNMQIYNFCRYNCVILVFRAFSFMADLQCIVCKHSNKQVKMELAHAQALF